MGGVNNMQTHPPTFVNLVIMSLALHLSIAIYVFVAFFLEKSAGWAEGWHITAEKQILLFALSGASIMTGLLAVIFPRLMKAKAPEPSVASSPLGQEENLIFSFQTIDPRTQSLTIIRMALAESIALFGLILAFLNQSAPLILPYAAAALLLQFVVGPIFGKMYRR